MSGYLLTIVSYHSEQRTQFSLWCILHAPLIVGSDLRNISDTTLATLSNKAAANINQDTAANPPKILAKTSTAQVWLRALHNGDVVVAMINTGGLATDITLQLADVVCTSCPRKATHRALVSPKNYSALFRNTSF